MDQKWTKFILKYAVLLKFYKSCFYNTNSVYHYYPDLRKFHYFLHRAGMDFTGQEWVFPPGQEWVFLPLFTLLANNFPGTLKIPT